MNNWIIFLLHFMVGVCYIGTGVTAANAVNVNGDDKPSFLLLSLAIILTVTAAWV